jgi:glycosyltransferase involved in cell wall biosynthesis
MWKVAEEVFVFEPTLREVEWLTKVFNHITWIGYDYGSKPKTFARPTLNEKIRFIPIRHVTGGSSLIAKFKILPHLPRICYMMIKAILRHEHIHTRGPSVPALIAVLFSCIDRKRFYWHKYAGNWKQTGAPAAYAFQRFILHRCKHTVSVNGLWPGQSRNIINLENPCLTQVEVREAAKWKSNKIDRTVFTLCFVGSLTLGKGIWEFLRALSLLKTKEKLASIWIAGDGPDRKDLENFASTLKLSVQFFGNVKRQEVNHIYQQSDAIILPSASEGFPKVVAEAAAFGCIPIVSDVSSISQYVHDGKNGILLRDTKPETIARAIDQLLTDNDKRIQMIQEATLIAPLFTYERYCTRLRSEILR